MLKEKNKMIMALISLIVFSAEYGFASCPIESGELTSCENEQAVVDTALSSVTIDEEFNYCKVGTTSTNELNCRKVVTYKDSSTGVATDSVFEDWLQITKPQTVTEPKSLLTFRIIFVKNSNGKYDAFWDDAPTSTTTVDKVIVDTNGTPLQEDVDVTFDADNLPSFEISGLNVSTGQVITLDISYSSTSAVVDFIGTTRVDTFEAL